jgi:mannose-6-phosphate isomerase-like protein (cupin superfamily)
MPITHASLNDDAGWMNMPLEVYPSYMWEDGTLLSDHPEVDFAATFADNMDVSTTPIDLMAFLRNPLRVKPGYSVPRHSHNIDETVIVLQGEYTVTYGPLDDLQSVVVRRGGFFTSKAGTPYTMTAGPEGVMYIETWGVPVTALKTVWHDQGWVKR